MANVVSDLSQSVCKSLGGQVALAAAIGVNQQDISYWLKRKGCFPAEHILKIEALLRGKGINIDRYDLRPDVYGERPSAVSCRAI